MAFETIPLQNFRDAIILNQARHDEYSVPGDDPRREEGGAAEGGGPQGRDGDAEEAREGKVSAARRLRFRYACQDCRIEIYPRNHNRILEIITL